VKSISVYKLFQNTKFHRILTTFWAAHCNWKKWYPCRYATNQFVCLLKYFRHIEAYFKQSNYGSAV